jgi:hypothetical protein
MSVITNRAGNRQKATGLKVFWCQYFMINLCPKLPGDRDKKLCLAMGMVNEWGIGTRFIAAFNKEKSDRKT